MTWVSLKQKMEFKIAHYLNDEIVQFELHRPRVISSFPTIEKVFFVSKMMIPS